MIRFQKTAILVVLGFTTLTLAPTSASAAFLPEFTGYTQMSLTSGGAANARNQGLVNFAVYENLGGGSWIAALGLGAAPPVFFPPSADPLAHYVYFYQVVNNQAAGGAKLSTFKVFSGPTPYTSAGYLTSKVFYDDAGVGPAGNQYLGDPDPGIPPAGAVLGAGPTHKGVVFGVTQFITDLAALPPTGGDTGGDPNDSATFNWGLPGAGLLGPGAYSMVVFLTSNAPPIYARGDLRDGVGDPDVGDVPAQAPVPATLLVATIGIVGHAGSYGWRRWRSQQAIRIA
jgi:hypothetical protein